MNPWKVIGWIGAVAVTGVGGYFAWRFVKRRREAKKNGDRPSRAPSGDDETPPESDGTSDDVDWTARHRLLGAEDVRGTDLGAELDAAFPNGWPATDAAIEQLRNDDIIMYAVESEPVGDLTSTRREIVNARVLSVEKDVVRARVYGRIKHAEHFGTFSGHGVRVGDSVEVPHANILVAARYDQKPQGYGSLGPAAATFKLLNKGPHTVKPGVPYDLMLPYRTEDLHWYVTPSTNRDFIRIGSKGALEQVMFGESTLRGDVKVTVVDRDQKAGEVYVAHWNFKVAD